MEYQLSAHTVISTASEVDRRPDLSVKDFQEQYRNPGRPVVIPGATRNWKAFGRWTPELLKDNWGTKVVEIDGYSYKFDEFIDMVVNSDEDDPAPYLVECDMTVQFPELLPEIYPPFPYLFPNRLMNKLVRTPGTSAQYQGYPELLIGGRGGQFPMLHYDSGHIHAFITQIYGDKEFTLFEPQQSIYLYPIEGFDHMSSIRDIDDPDLLRFPLFEKATPKRVIVKQGETIFVPAGWWHVTKMLTPSIAVSMNSVSRSNWDAFCKDYLKTQDRRNRMYLTPYLYCLGKYFNLLNQ